MKVLFVIGVIVIFNLVDYTCLKQTYLKKSDQSLNKEQFDKRFNDFITSLCKSEDITDKKTLTELNKEINQNQRNEGKIKYRKINKKNDDDFKSFCFITGFSAYALYKTYTLARKYPKPFVGVSLLYCVFKALPNSKYDEPKKAYECSGCRYCESPL